MLWCSHGLGLFALEVHGLVCNGFRNGLQQALHVLQLWPSFIQPVSSQRRQTGSLRGGGAAVLITATCLLVSSSSRFPIAVVSSMIDPFICFLLTTENAMIDHGGSPHLSHSSARRCSSRSRASSCSRTAVVF